MITRRTVIVVSRLIDSTIREYQPDVEFNIFGSIQDLAGYIEMAPLRAKTLYVTKDVIPESAINSNLTYLLSMLKNPFLTCDEVKYLTEKESPEIPTFKYIIESQGLDNWEIVEGAMTREYINSYINGTLREEDFNPKRKVVYRMSKDAYYRERREEKSSLNEEYDADEDYLKDIPDEKLPIEILPEATEPCKIKSIIGVDSKERTALTFLCAQYLSFSGKTLILERDIEYHTLGDMVAKSGVDAFIVDMTDFLNNPELWIENIKKSNHSLICVLTKKRIKYSYSFMLNLLYNNLIDNLSYIVNEGTFEDTPNNSSVTICIPSNMMDILKTIENVDRSYVLSAKFVAVNSGAFPELNVGSSAALETILCDTLSSSTVNVVNITLKGLKLQGDMYDLNKIF